MSSEIGFAGSVLGSEPVVLPYATEKRSNAITMHVAFMRNLPMSRLAAFNLTGMKILPIERTFAAEQHASRSRPPGSVSVILQSNRHVYHHAGRSIRISLGLHRCIQVYLLRLGGCIIRLQARMPLNCRGAIDRRRFGKLLRRVEFIGRSSSTDSLARTRGFSPKNAAAAIW